MVWVTLEEVCVSAEEEAEVRCGRSVLRHTAGARRRLKTTSESTVGRPPRRPAPHSTSGVGRFFTFPPSTHAWGSCWEL